MPLDEEQYLELVETEPPLTEVKAHWTSVLLGPSHTANADEQRLDETNAHKLLGELEKLADQYPAVGDEKVELSPSVVFITNPEEVKSKLRLSNPAKPVEDFSGELPLLNL